jgi:hypothetical protein
LADASWLAAAMVSVAESGSSTEPRISKGSNAPTTIPLTRTTYRSLLQRGLAPDEASNLTAFLCGIPVGTQQWKIGEVNRLLFLRELQSKGRFGPEDGAIAVR